LFFIILAKLEAKLWNKRWYREVSGTFSDNFFFVLIFFSEPSILIIINKINMTNQKLEKEKKEKKGVWKKRKWRIWGGQKRGENGRSNSHLFFFFSACILFFSTPKAVYLQHPSSSGRSWTILQFFNSNFYSISLKLSPFHQNFSFLRSPIFKKIK